MHVCHERSKNSGLFFPFEGILPHLTIQLLSNNHYENDYSSQKIIIGEQRQTNLKKSTPHLLVGNISLPYSSRKERNEKGRMNIEISIPHEGDVNKARCCPQKNQIIATKTSHGDVLLFDYTWHSSQSEKIYHCLPQLRLRGHKKSEGYGLSWNYHHEGLILSSSYDNSICIWDIAIGGRRNTLQANTIILEQSDIIEDVLWMPFHKNVFGMVGSRGTLAFYDTRSKKQVSRQRINDDNVNSLSFSLYSDILLALGVSDGSICVMDMRRLHIPVYTLRGHDGAVKKASFSPLQPALLASSGEDGNLCIWNLNWSQKPIVGKGSIQSELHLIHEGFNVINDFSWSSIDVKMIAMAGQHKSLIWKPET